ncbi:NAD-dependent epimerase/dehydratase [Natrialba chahannaoensis JCM 10990]|uniref:NAD-dependent epimerase/dehydratase n=1 Tax=Natrialba chahannaoensis JCM 10990 TaxID=1227492 RepID=M0A954_9EURY|nr:NAD-dependent epimerase/dehydratase family protein [Natrialba chahannaoensis]ELY95310.1 NAD-dependent epimerase/dehydratase [Natrialba chahannaoensis JCM 10990]
MTSPAIRDRTVLVTGGGGFIGSHLVEALAPYNDVRVLDNFSTGSRDNLSVSSTSETGSLWANDTPASADGGIDDTENDDGRAEGTGEDADPDPDLDPDGSLTIVDGDISDPMALQRAARGVDLIFHQAALVSVTESVDAPRRSNETNLDASLLVLDQARQEDARVVLASSAAVYGHPDELPISETATTEPTSPYGIQKLALDQYARSYHELYDLPTVALRYFNAYGPRQQGPYSGVISTFLEQARADEPITIEGDGEQTRDFVHVSDIVRANLLAATTDAVGEAYNVGTGERTSIRDLAELVRDAVGSSSPIVHRDPRSGDIRHSRADVSKVRHELGFEARVGLESGIRSLVTGAAGEQGYSSPSTQQGAEQGQGQEQQQQETQQQPLVARPERQSQD